jgi:GNAT superfamily N-acetyltransferase
MDVKPDAVRLTTFAEQPDILEKLLNVDRPGDPVAKQDPSARYVDRLLSESPATQLVLYEADQRTVLGWALTVASRWDFDPHTLPDGVAAVIEEGLQTDLSEASVLSAVVVYVRPEFRDQGLSYELVGGVLDLARHLGLHGVVIPVRPSLKSRYPLAPMSDYMHWQNSEGLPVDDWLRVHVKLGGRILGVCDRAVVKTATVAEWEMFVRMLLPQSGRYVVPGALVPIEVDRERDVAVYVEPNIWVFHAIQPNTLS